MYGKNTLKGKFTPKNPSKYKGNITNIIYRSSWEKKMMIYCDLNKNVVSWSSEEFHVKYISPKDNQVHRYFIDFAISIRDNEGKLQNCLIEVKPYNQTIPPPEPKKRTKRYLMEQMTYGINMAKWAAARAFCEQHNLKFLVFTENELGIKR
jgi:hypothetical protein